MYIEITIPLIAKGQLYFNNSVAVCLLKFHCLKEKFLCLYTYMYDMDGCRHGWNLAVGGVGVGVRGRAPPGAAGRATTEPSDEGRPSRSTSEWRGEGGARSEK